MKNLFLPSLSIAINKYLELDSESKQRLKKLQGKAITIELLPFHFTFQCVFKEQGVDIQSDELIATETTIRGTPLQMMGVMMIKDNRQHFFADDLVIEGDAEFGQQVIGLFDELQIDWEEHLSHFIGDAPAYYFGRFIRDVNEWLHDTEKTVSENVSEYIHEERKWLPAREELQDFFSDIDSLRMDTDRAAARIKNLRAYLTENEEKQ